jgi:hypothetical protein
LRFALLTHQSSVKIGCFPVIKRLGTNSNLIFSGLDEVKKLTHCSANAPNHVRAAVRKREREKEKEEQLTQEKYPAHDTLGSR